MCLRLYRLLFASFFNVPRRVCLNSWLDDAGDKDRVPGNVKQQRKTFDF